MIITINGQHLNWPKPSISEEQLRLYADADQLNDIWQINPAGGAMLVKHTANVYDGAEFHARPKTA